MITAKKNPLVEWFFSRYILKLVKKNFAAINIDPIDVDKNRPVLLIANHFSWWDGFILYYVNHAILKKKFHVMVIEETVQRFFFMKYLGAFSVKKGTRGIAQSINYAAELLSDPQNMVVIFPQGHFRSNFIKEVTFQKGVFRILEKCSVQPQLIFVAAFIEHLRHKKPVVNVYLKKEEKIQYENMDQLTAAYQVHYNHAIEQQTQIVV